MTQKAAAKRYLLKPMVAARLGAEASVFVILLALPLVLLALGKLLALSFTYKLIVAICTLCGLVMMPVYGFITFKVTVTEDELTTHCLFRKQSCALDKIKGLTRRSNWNWIRYVVEYEDGDLTFPIWLKHCDELVETIRQRIPGGFEGKRSPFGRLFKMDPVGLGFQLAQASAGLIFIAVVWIFAVTLYHSGSSGISAADELLVLVFAAIISAILLWRTYVVALMPRVIELKSGELVLRTFFFNRELAWTEIKSVKEPFPLLPEGFMLHTKKGSYLVGNGMDSADELSETIKEKINPPEPLALEPTSASASESTIESSNESSSNDLVD